MGDCRRKSSSSSRLRQVVAENRTHDDSKKDEAEENHYLGMHSDVNAEEDVQSIEGVGNGVTSLSRERSRS